MLGVYLGWRGPWEAQNQLRASKLIGFLLSSQLSLQPYLSSRYQCYHKLMVITVYCPHMWLLYHWGGGGVGVVFLNFTPETTLFPCYDCRTRRQRGMVEWTGVLGTSLC